MKKLMTLLILMVAFSVNAAEKNQPSILIEIEGSDIVVSNDGTGFVKNVECRSCTSKILRITNKTRAFENGQPIDLVNSRKRYINKGIMLRFDPDTREVLVVRWQ